MRKTKYNPAKIYNNVRINFNNSRNVSMEKLKTLDPAHTFHNPKNSLEDEKVGQRITYNINDSITSGRGVARPTKTSRKGVRRGTNHEAKFYPSGQKFTSQFSPKASNRNITNINYQEGANVSYITNKKKMTHRITTRRNFNNVNASMLSGETPEILSEDRKRYANESAAPNVVIYQKFVSI
jgi:hypothetical protein